MLIAWIVIVISCIVGASLFFEITRGYGTRKQKAILWGSFILVSIINSALILYIAEILTT